MQHQDQTSPPNEELTCLLDRPSNGEYDEEDIKLMDQLSKHPSRQTTLDMFQRKASSSISIPTTTANHHQLVTSPLPPSLSSIDEGQKTPPPSPSISTSYIKNRSSSLTRIPSASSSLYRSPSLRRAKTNVFRFSNHHHSLSVIPRHHTILEDVNDGFDIEKEANDEQEPLILTPTFFRRARKRQSSTITLRSDQTLWSTVYNEEGSIPSTSNITFEKIRGDSYIAPNQNGEEQENLTSYSYPLKKEGHSGEKGKDVVQAHKPDNIPHCPVNIEEMIPWIGNLSNYITQTQNEIQYKEQEIIKLRQELKLLVEIRVRAKQKVQVDMQEKKKEEKNNGTGERGGANKSLFVAIRKQAVNCIAIVKKKRSM